MVDVCARPDSDLWRMMMHHLTTATSFTTQKLLLFFQLLEFHFRIPMRLGEKHDSSFLGMEFQMRSELNSSQSSQVKAGEGKVI